MSFSVALLGFAVYMGWIIFRGLKDYYEENEQALNNRNEDEQSLQPRPNYLVYHGTNLNFSDAEIDLILNKYFPYYTHLTASLQITFLKRVQEFIAEKSFIIRHYEGYKEMPVLLSAAAIQISFGLDRFLLPFFKYIQVHPQEYFAENSLRVLAGNVYGNTITIAWNHFLKGFKEADGSNVGLHEMAHALYYQHLIADVSKHEHFVENYERLMLKCQETYDTCKARQDRLYSDYAFTDLQEFWAESPELFFEKPENMQFTYPDLFSSLCTLLKQNPKYKSEPTSYSC